MDSSIFILISPKLLLKVENIPKTGHLEPHSPHVHLDKVNKGKLHQGHEDKGEADDDVDIQRCGVRDSHFVFLTNKPDRNNSCTGENDPGDCLSEGGRSLTQTAGDAETNPGHDLSPGGGVDQPEGDPGAGHDDDEREVGPGRDIARHITMKLMTPTFLAPFGQIKPCEEILSLQDDLVTAVYDYISLIK